MTHGPGAGGSGEQLGLFLEAGRPAFPPPAGNPTAAGLYTFENLWHAYRECRRTKRGTLNALDFERDAEARLFDLQDELLAHRYRPGTSICFVSDGAKPREVFAADFRDRIVHHLLLRRIEPGFERRFIHDSYACRKGRGVLAASDRLMQFLREATANGRRPAWALKLDVASFFPSIRKDILYGILCRTVRDPELRWLMATILFHDPTLDYVFHKGPSFVRPPWDRRYPVEARKSLFGRSGETGLPIGNLTSQFWANCYLNEVDQFAKRELGCRWYLRYVDDLVLLAPDAASLEVWRERVREFASERLGLSLRTTGDEPFPVSRGVDFAGWKAWVSHRVPRRRTLGNLEHGLAEATRAMITVDDAQGTQVVGLKARVVRKPGRAAHEVLAVEALRATLASYSGHLRWGGGFRAWREVLRRHAWVSDVIAVDGWTVAMRWGPKPGRAPRLWQQYHLLASAAAKGTLVFCPVGAFVEFRGEFAEEAAAALGLRCVPLPRGQWAFGAGFPRALVAAYTQRAVHGGFTVATVREGTWRGHRACRGREVVRVVRPRGGKDGRSCGESLDRSGEVQAGRTRPLPVSVGASSEELSWPGRLKM